MGKSELEKKVEQLEAEIERLGKQMILVSKILECLVADDGK